MSRMIPPIFDDSTKSEAEKSVYYLLSNVFDDNWIIFHSYSIEGINLENKIIDAEIDFIIMNKDHGLLIMEVKGGQIKCVDGKWSQNGIEIKDPYKQALSNKYLIRNHLAKYLNEDPPIAIGHCVFFPDTFQINDKIGGAHELLTITGQHLKYLDEAVITIMKMQKSQPYKTDQLFFDTIKKALIPLFEYGYSVADRIEKEDRKIFKLTEKQCELLYFISEHKKALIRGCAGSGKTVMALKKAHYIAAEGKEVLLLCYNNLLAEYISNEVKSYPNINAFTYHQLCGKTLEDAGIKLDFQKDLSIFFRKDLPQKFLEYIIENPIKWDAVIVDEGQDFLDEYWYTINELVKPDGYYYIFYDPDQNIYDSELKLPQLGPAFMLNKNCRNTKAIFTKLKEIINNENQIFEEAPQGEAVQIFSCPDANQLRKKLSQILHDLTVNKKINERQIVILGTHHLRNTSIGEENHVGKFIIKENGPADINTIPYYTCMKFKGMESDVVIILDFHDKRWENKAIQYTAFSRAKHILYILGF